MDGFYKHNQLIRTNYNKCGSEDDKKIRVVPLPTDFGKIIQKYIQEKNLDNNDYVFQRYNKPIRKWLAEEWFRRAVKQSGIDAGNRILTPHSLRYTYILLQKGGLRSVLMMMIWLNYSNFLSKIPMQEI